MYEINRKLKKIEQKISNYLTSDRKNWAETYLLMKEVRDKKLYSRKYDSFTQWVNQLADQNHYHQSTLWNRFKAGNVYAEYVKRQREAGNYHVKSIKEVDISPDTVALVGTIANRSKNKKYTDELMKKALNHELSRQDLREVNQKIKAENSRPQHETDKKLHDIKVKQNDIKITADDMVEAFNASYNWLDPTHFHRRNDFYRVYAELPVRSGTSHHARRMDECILENITDPHAYSDHVNIHAVENKVAKNDLIHDHKMGEYADYADFFWLCVPKQLVKVTEAYIADGWGILICDDNENISIHRKAKRRRCLFREHTLTEAVIHDDV